MVSQLIHERGHICIFLPKFHCDLNWAENHLGKAKPFVRTLCDGTWLAMCQGTWLAFGEGNINDDLCQRSCCVEFMDGGVRNDVRLEDLGRVADDATIRR